LQRYSIAAGDPPHDRVKAEPAGSVHVVAPAKVPENGLAEQPGKTAPVTSRRPREQSPYGTRPGGSAVSAMLAP